MLLDPGGVPVLEHREGADDPLFSRQVLEALAFGVIVVDAAFERIHLINHAAARLVSSSMGAPGQVPRALAQAVASAPVRIVISGRVVLLGMNPLPGRPDRIILTLTTLDDDVVDVFGAMRARYGLSSRELQVMRWLRLGLRNREIAERMALTVATVKSYIGNVLAAVQVRNRTELVALIERMAGGRS